MLPKRDTSVNRVLHQARVPTISVQTTVVTLLISMNVPPPTMSSVQLTHAAAIRTEAFNVTLNLDLYVLELAV